MCAGVVVEARGDAPDEPSAEDPKATPPFSEEQEWGVAARADIGRFSHQGLSVFLWTVCLQKKLMPPPYAIA